MAYKLLLADDSVTIQRVIELTFADEDVKVVAVGDGQQAIDRVQADPPDIVLADVGMPQRDGYEVAAFIKGTPALAHIPVLLLTGAFEPVDEERVRAAQCDGVLAKPFEPQQLIGRVKDLLSGVRRASSAPAAAEPVAEPASPPPASAAEDLMLARPADDDDATQPLPTLPAGGAEPPLDPGTLHLNPEPTPGDASLDDYFDRLDAAFAHLTGQASGHDESGSAHAPAAGPPTPEPSGGVTWSSGPTAPAEVEAGVASPAVLSGPGQEPGRAVQPSVAEVTTGVPVADAFSSLLELERQHGPAAAEPGVPSTLGVAIADAFLGDLARRVAAQLGEKAVRDIVADVVSTTAERLVREEIARIKASVR
jgi:CheY-like chemotaxis protein